MNSYEKTRKKQYLLIFRFCCTGNWTSLLRVKAVLLHVRKAHKGERIIDLPLPNLRARTGLEVKFKLRPLYLRKMKLSPVIQGAGGISEPIWILVPAGFQTLIRTASSELLYRLSNAGRHSSLYFIHKSHRLRRIFMEEKHRINKLVCARLR